LRWFDDGTDSAVDDFVLESDAPDTLSYNDGSLIDAHLGTPDVHLVMALDSQRPLTPTARISIGGVQEVLLGRGDTPTIQQNLASDCSRLRVEVPDTWMSATHARLVRGHGWWMIEDAGSKNGTRVNGATASRLPLSDGDVIEIGGTFFIFDSSSPRLDGEPRFLATNELSSFPPAMVTLDLSLARQFAGLSRIAPSAVPVVIVGESGTGKEVTVRALHELSGRSGKLVAINCGAIPESLIESELFGCKRGAFSGATEERLGLIRSAEGGTLFLDEVAELPEASQATLLRFLQEGEVRPVGAAEVHRVDTRVVAATHQDLAERVRNGTFRQDLFARLAGFRIELPPLRERREDLGNLVGAILRDLVPERADSIRLRPSAARAFFDYDFPLNIRELRHALQSALALSDDSTIAREHLPDAIARVRTQVPLTLSAKDQSIRDTVERLLRANDGNVSAVAREMGKAPVQIRRWCKRFDIDLEALRCNRH